MAATSSARASSAYRALGYVPFDLDVRRRNANSLFGDPEAVWASAATTLEYAIADFSIAQFAARALGDRATYRSFISRSGNWRNLLNPDSGQIEPRFEDGAFAPDYDNLRGAGFAEGNSAQYTWMVPQDPAGLFAAIGGRADAVSRLDRFLRTLNGGPGATHADHALLGNEPNLNVPWLYDWAGQPYKTQAAVRRALRLYDASPDGYPGNDDLGTLSSWYVLGALGLYPEVPGVDVLAIGSPLFGRATVRLAGGRKLRIVASAYRRSSRHGRPRVKPRLVPLSLSRAPYIQTMRIDGHPYGTTLDDVLRARPRGDPRLPARGATEPRLGRLRRRAAAVLRHAPADARESLRSLTTERTALDRPLGAGRPDRAGARRPLRQPRRAELPPRRGDHRRAGHPRRLRPTCCARSRGASPTRPCTTCSPGAGRRRSARGRSGCAR